MALINQILNGYQFIEFIGSGSFGSVYKAQKDGVTYAIKAFREDYVLQEYRQKGEKNRIHREIEIMKSVDHPYLVKYVDDFQAVDLNVPSYFLVMEFAEGKTLQKLIDEGELKTEKEAVAIFSKILQGIKALHQVRGNDDEKGIIHRDLKPDNIIVSNDGVKIIDYGISRIIDYTSLTSTGNFLGSPLYSSPEQIVDSKNIDKRSDLYTLGVILYQMVTSALPYAFSNLPDLINKIQNEHPIPPRKWQPTISNKLENIIFKLLEKLPYQRFLTIDDLIDSLNASTTESKSDSDLSGVFILRLYDEATVLQRYFLNYPGKLHVEFPAIHQFRQKTLLAFIQNGRFERMVDPETVRFAYSTYTDRVGLKNLPYCPPDYQIITPAYLRSYQKQQEYVRMVIDEEAKLGADILVSPYHYTHNSTILPTYKSNPVEQWFDLDIKLLKESIDYKNSKPEYHNKKLFAGICIHSSSLIDEGYKNDLLNHYTAHACDGYLVYADGIDKNTNEITLYHYLDTLLKLQTYTGKPVIAGRLGGLGLGLISLGLAGYTSGAARFETFNEDLHKEATKGYNLYERYYFRPLLGTIAIERKVPTRLNLIAGAIGACQCQYCKGKPPQEVISSQNNKLHFLNAIHKEVDHIKAVANRRSYFLSRIDEAIMNYQKLPHVFKKDDYNHLFVWKAVFNKIP
jgi:eukaryotic-like serine/threonine-protein kinase